MITRYTMALLVAGVAGSFAVAQDPGPTYQQGTSFATIGRPPVPTILGGRVLDRVEDTLDRYPCCGYGKTHNDMGVPGYRSSISFYWGGACEFFREDCRRSTANTEPKNPGKPGLLSVMFGSGCKSCGNGQ